MDERLRQLERDALRDPQAQERLAMERIRAGGRDPRRDPRAGDQVAANYAIFTRDGTKRGTSIRTVQEVWPRALSAPFTYFSDDANDHERSSTLPAGTLVCSMVVEWQPQDGTPFAWHFYASGSRVTRHVSYHPIVLVDAPPGTEVDTVVWTWNKLPKRSPWESSLKRWRDWAKGGRVLCVSP